MRSLGVAMVVTVAAMFGSTGVAGAAPKDYCADLKGGNTGSTCEIQLSDPGYDVDISIPLDYPDQKSVADYISQTRDAFLSSAKSGAARTTPYVLSIKPEKYSSSVPPRGTQAVVFAVTQDVGAGPQRTYKAFNWDQSFRTANAHYDGGHAHDHHHTDHDHHGAPAATVAFRASRAVQPGQLPELRNRQRRGDLLLRPGRAVARLGRAVARAGAAVADCRHGGPHSHFHAITAMSRDAPATPVGGNRVRPCR